MECLGLVWAITLKANQPELLREAGRFTQGSPTGIHTEEDRETRYWRLPAARCVSSRRFASNTGAASLSAKKTTGRIKSQTAVTQASTNFPTTNFELGSIPPLFIHRCGRRRWRIDTEVFQTITTDRRLKHSAVHETTALAVLTMNRLLAFYHRQVRSHARGTCETFHKFARRIVYRFVADSLNDIRSPPSASQDGPRCLPRRP